MIFLFINTYLQYNSKLYKDNEIVFFHLLCFALEVLCLLHKSIAPVVKALGIAKILLELKMHRKCLIKAAQK